MQIFRKKQKKKRRKKQFRLSCLVQLWAVDVLVLNWCLHSYKICAVETHPHRGLYRQIFWAVVVGKIAITTMIKHSYKAVGDLYIEYKYIIEVMLWLHRGKCVNIKRVKAPSLAALQVAKYTRIAENVHEPLKGHSKVR